MSENKVWIDADGCPREIRAMVIRAAEKRQFKLMMVANQVLRDSAGKTVEKVVVDGKFDAADQYIVDHLIEGDLVISADVPLSDLVVKKGGVCLNTKGEIVDHTNIGERLATRDLMADLRGGGLVSGGSAPFGPKDKAKFASAFDKLLTRMLQNQKSMAQDS